MDSFEETLWIDFDIEFDPAGVDQLRAHGLPLCYGIYPQKGRQALACHVLPGTRQVVFGRAGGLLEILYAATGFLHVRRDVSLRIQHQLALPLTNERFNSSMLPFFYPLTEGVAGSREQGANAHHSPVPDCYLQLRDMEPCREGSRSSRYFHFSLCSPFVFSSKWVAIVWLACTAPTRVPP